MNAGSVPVTAVAVAGVVADDGVTDDVNPVALVRISGAALDRAPTTHVKAHPGGRRGGRGRGDVEVCRAMGNRGS